MHSESPRRIPELDGLRGIAAVGVVLFHWMPTYTFWMWSFVDLFFVLSGFLITGILLRDFQAGKLSLKAFWINRILRIWPVYYATLLVVVAYLLLAHRTALMNDPLQQRDIWLSLAFLQFTPLYAQVHADTQPVIDFLPGFLHSWSLAVEEQYYLAWPLLLIALLRRYSLPVLALFCVTLVFIAPILRIVAAPFPAILLVSRMDGLALGSLLAVLHHIPASTLPHFTKPLKSALYTGLLSIGLALVLPDIVAGYRGTLDPALTLEQRPLLVSGFALSYFALIALVLEHPLWPGFRLLRSTPLTYLGSISYALYMFHFPILEFMHKPRVQSLFGESWHFVLYPLTALLLIGLPHLSKIYLERPALALKPKLMRAMKVGDQSS